MVIPNTYTVISTEIYTYFFFFFFLAKQFHLIYTVS